MYLSTKVKNKNEFLLSVPLLITGQKERSYLQTKPDCFPLLLTTCTEKDHWTQSGFAASQISDRIYRNI